MNPTTTHTDARTLPRVVRRRPLASDATQPQSSRLQQRPCRDVVKRAALETLEHRRLLSGASLSDGVLLIEGDSEADNTATVIREGWDYVITLNGHTSWHRANSVDMIQFEGGSGDDTLDVAEHVAIPVLAYGYGGDDTFRTGGGNDTLHGGDGNDTVEVRGGINFVSGFETIIGDATVIEAPAGTDLTSMSSVPRAPYPSIHVLPTRIEAEHYDSGGQGVSFWDSDPNIDHGGGNARNTGVDKANNGQQVGWIRNGEWLEYTVRVTEAGSYRLLARDSSGSAGGTMTFRVNGQTVSRNFRTEGWWNFATREVGTVNLPAGDHVVRLTFNSNAGNDIGDLDWFEFQRVGGGSSDQQQGPFGGTARALPGRVQAEHFDEGGPGVAYHDSTWQQLGNSNVRANEQVDIANAWGNTHVGWTENGEWLEYTVDVRQAGTYEVWANVASGVDNGQITVKTQNGGRATRTLPNRGWGDFAERWVGEVTVPAGRQVVRLEFSRQGTGGTANVDWFEFRPRGSTPPPVQPPVQPPQPPTPPPQPPTPPTPPTPPPQPPTPPQPPSNPQPPTGQPPSTNAPVPTARITPTSSTRIMAGQAFHAHALDSTLRTGGETTARYEWDFGDGSGRYNQMVGFNAAHLYENPGTYTVRLRVFNEGGASHATTTQVTVSPDTRRRIHVAPWGNDSNNGLSTGQPVRTLGAAMSRLNQHGDNTAILLHRGHTYTTNTSLHIDRNNVVLGAYGNGDRPEILWNNHRNSVNNKNMVWFNFGRSGLTIRDLKFETTYGGDTSSDNVPAAIQPGGDNVTVVNNTFGNVGHVVLGSAGPRGVLVLNNRVPGVTDLRQYFTWIQGSDWTILGNSVANSTREHIVRVHGGERLNIGDNKLANIDRRGQGDSHDTAKGVLNIQRGTHAYAWGNELNGVSGVGPLGRADGMTTTWARFRHNVFEGNYVRGGYLIEHGAENVHVRSNVFFENDGSPINIAGHDSAYNRTTRDVHVVNNTIINNGARGHFARVGSGTVNTNLANNLFVAPNLYAGEYGTAIVQVNAPDLRGFGKIQNNVWADPDFLQWSGGVLWVGTGQGNSGYRTPQQWLAYPQVTGDRFSDTTINSSFRPNGGVATTAGREYPGVFTDFHGNWRDPNGRRAVGAVEA